MAFSATIAFQVSVPPAPLIIQKAVVTTEDGDVSFSFHHVHFVLWDVTLQFCLPKEVMTLLSWWNTSVTLLLMRQNQENQKIKVALGYIVSSRPV